MTRSSLSSSSDQTANPLLDFSDLPRFDAIKPEHVEPAITCLLEENNHFIAKLQNDMTAAGWKDFVMPLEQITQKLSRAWSIVRHLNAVADTPELRAVYNENQPKVTEFWTSLSQNPALFAKYKALKNSAEYVGLSSARQRIIENALRDFRLGGAELPADKKQRFAKIQGRTGRSVHPFFRKCSRRHQRVQSVY